MEHTSKPIPETSDEVEISCRFGERVIVDRDLLRKASDLDLDAPARLIVTHQPFYAVYSVTRMLVGGQRIQLTVDNVIDFWSTAKALHLRVLVEQLENFVADHLNEVARVKSEMLKIDQRLLERLLEKRRGKGVSRILYRWWRADVKNRQTQFVRLVDKFTPENDDETLSASTEETNALKKVEVLKRRSASEPALNEFSSFARKEFEEPNPSQTQADEHGRERLSNTEAEPSDAIVDYPALGNKPSPMRNEGAEDRLSAKAEPVFEEVDLGPPLKTANRDPISPKIAAADAQPEETSPVISFPPSPAAVDTAPGEALATPEKPQSDGKAVEKPSPVEAEPSAPSPAVPASMEKIPKETAAVDSALVPPTAGPSPLAEPSAVTAAPKRSVVINNVFGKPLSPDPTPRHTLFGNRIQPRPSFSRRFSARPREPNHSAAKPVPLRMASSKSESVNSAEPVRLTRAILVGDKICEYQGNCVRALASVGRDIPPNNVTIVCDPSTRTYAEIDCYGSIRTYLSHIETSTKIQKVRAIMTQLDESRPLLWMDDGSFHTLLDKKLVPCPNEIPDSSPLRNLPDPPHEGWLARMYLGADCALLYYHCWGLYVRRRNDASWKLRCEELFIEYMTPIGRSNRFFVIAKQSPSFVLYKTEDLTQECDLMFASEPVALLKNNRGRDTRCAIVHAACSGVRVMFKILNLSTSTVQFERVNILDFRITSLAIA